MRETREFQFTVDGVHVISDHLKGSYNLKPAMSITVGHSVRLVAAGYNYSRWGAFSYHPSRFSVILL